MSSTEDEIVEVCPDKQVLPTLLAYQVIDALGASEQAAYMVYMILATRFGAGQRI